MAGAALGSGDGIVPPGVAMVDGAARGKDEQDKEALPASESTEQSRSKGSPEIKSAPKGIYLNAVLMTGDTGRGAAS